MTFCSNRCVGRSWSWLSGQVNCQPCRQELPFLSNVQDQVGGDELQVVAVNLGENGRTVGQAYRAWKGWGDLLVTRDLRGRASRAMGVSYVPTTLVFDPRGEFVDAILRVHDRWIQEVGRPPEQPDYGRARGS